MNRILMSLVLYLLMSSAIGQSVPNFELAKLEGGSVSLSVYSGKKLMIVNLPVSRTAEADTMLYCLDTLAAAHVQQLQIIVVPSFEDGFNISQRATLLQWYRAYLRPGILITDGFHLLQSSSAQQHPLFEWLTDESMNQSFDVQPDAPGYKFFIDTLAKLYAVLRPQSKVGGASVQKVLRMP